MDRYLADHGLELQANEKYDTEKGPGWKWVLRTCVWDAGHTNASGYIVMFPGVTLVLFVLSWNLVGDALRDAMKKGAP